MGNLPRREALEKQISLLPVLQMRVETLAGDVADDTFTDRDFVTFRFRITKNATDGVAFLPSYGYLKREKFYLTLEAADELLFFEEVVFEPGQTECLVEYSYKDTSATDTTFLAIVRSDCYYGLDIGKQIPLKFTEYSGPEVIGFLCRK